MRLCMRLVVPLPFCFALAVVPLAAQGRAWGVGFEIGLTRFWGASEPAPPNEAPGFKPYRPTTLGVRLEHQVGQARLALGALYAASGLGAESDQLAVIAKGGLNWVQVAPDV